MKMGELYTARHDLSAFTGRDDEDCKLSAGQQYTAVRFDVVRDMVYGELYRLPRHVAANPGWYFSSGFNPQLPVVSLQELAYELVRCNEGLQVDQLYSLACEACPRETPTYSSFTAALSADERIIMRNQKTGEIVKGLGHNTRCNSYHVRRLMTK